MTDGPRQQWAFQEAVSPFAHERALFLERNIFTAPNEISALFGASAFCDPLHRQRLSLNRLAAAGFDRLVFGNPYGASDSRRLYQDCRQQGFPILVCERGMLPGTVLLDQSGFLADSLLFEPSLIDRAKRALPNLSLTELRVRYLGRPALERQKGKSVDLAALESSLRSAPAASKPKVLIALQDSQDTAVRFFSHKGLSYDAFLQFAGNLCERYAPVCDFTFKPHPRELNTNVAGARRVNHLNIADAIAQASHVLCFSSGVGLLAMLLERPVGHFGVPQYHQCAAVRAVRSFDEFDQFLQTGFADNRESAVDYLSYADAIYSHVNFYSMSMRRILDRDIYARYDQVRIASGNGVYEHRAKKAGLLDPKRTWPFRALSRSVRNRLKLGYHTFSDT